MELTFSLGLPMIGLLAYMAYAEANGIKLEHGCEGPGVPFGMLGGILFTVIQRFKLREKSDHNATESNRRDEMQLLLLEKKSSLGT